MSGLQLLRSSWSMDGGKKRIDAAGQIWEQGLACAGQITFKLTKLK